MQLGKYSIGIGDRFGHQGLAQLKAVQKAQAAGATITPVWNKSYREHTIIGSQPMDTRRAADAAVKNGDWQEAYFVDADHIQLKTVDLFLDASNFFTIDVADFIGQKAENAALTAFVKAHQKYAGELLIPGLSEPFHVTPAQITSIASQYLYAIQAAGEVYRHIQQKKGAAPFVVEVSLDETREPQSPVEMFFILAAIAREKIPLQTIAPKFSGRFNKGVDYVGDVSQFTREFEADLAVIQSAVKTFRLPAELKLSVHSGSDKFALYQPISKALHRFQAGLHLKTAGTTWLEEVIGLAEGGDEGLVIAKEIYQAAYSQATALCKPYATVIDIHPERLPAPTEVAAWDSHRFVATLWHDATNPHYNASFRQLLHIAYKVAADMGARFQQALER